MNKKLKINIGPPPEVTEKLANLPNGVKEAIRKEEEAQLRYEAEQAELKEQIRKKMNIWIFVVSVVLICYYFFF